MKWIKKSYLQSIPQRFGVCSVVLLFFGFIAWPLLLLSQNEVKAGHFDLN